MSKSKWNKPTVIIAILTILVPLIVGYFNYEFTESVRTKIENQKIDLDKMKVDIASATQKTDESRLLLETQIYSWHKKFKEQEIQTASKREQTERERLEHDRTNKIAKELHPSVAINCKPSIVKSIGTQPKIINIDCFFKNQGVHRIHIIPLLLNMFDEEKQKLLDGAIERRDHLTPTYVALGGNDSWSQYKIVLTEFGALHFKNGYALGILFKASTVPTDVNIIKRQLKGAIKDNELKEMSEFSTHYIMKL